MKNRLLAVLLSLISFCCIVSSAAAQNNEFWITGNTDFVCAGSCWDYSVNWNPDDVNIDPTITFFDWSMYGPGGYVSSDTGKTAFFCFDFPGTYNIQVFVGSINGQVFGETAITVYVLPYIPVEIISSNIAPCNTDSSSIFNACEKVCPNTTVTYSMEGQGNPSGQGAFWSITGASSYTVNGSGQSVTVVWGEPGTGNITLVTTGSTGGCGGTATRCVTIVEEPEADFTTDPAAASNVVQICKGQTVWFTNTSQNADLYEWNFGDGASETASTSPQHTYLQAGTYTVTLIARSNCFCADTTTLNIEVLDTQAPLLDCVGTVCPGETVTYTTSASCSAFDWAVSPNGAVLGGGGSADNSITVQWMEGPQGVITLGVQSCSGAACPAPATMVIPVISDLAEIRGPERVCALTTAEYTIDKFDGTEYNWSVSSGGFIKDGWGTERISVEWTAQANQAVVHWIIVEYYNCYLGCSGRDSLPVRILPNMYLNGPVEICENASGTFNARLTTGQGINSNWTLTGPGGVTSWTSASPVANASIPFLDGPGYYRIFATPDNPALTCSDNAEWAVRAAANPAVPTGIDGPTPVCPGKTLTYEALGETPGNNIRWTIQNGPGAPFNNSGNPINVSWNANGPRWIAAAQVSADNLGCASDTVRLDVAAIGAFAINGTPNACLYTLGSYSGPAFEKVDFQWQIIPADAGTVKSGQGTSNVEIFWNTAGTHQLILNICGQSASFPVTVWPTPNPKPLAPAGLCPGDTELVPLAGTFALYTWTDEGGNILSDSAKAWVGPGIYVVSVVDLNGCAGSGEFSIEEYPVPNLTISTPDPTGFCNNSETVHISALTTAGGDFDYEWFLDGAPFGGNTSSISTSLYGLYTAQATNQFGCQATAGPILVFEYCGPNGQCHNPGHAGPCPPGSVTFSIDQSMRCDSFHFNLNAGPAYLAGSAVWHFGESGSTYLGSSALENPSFIFPNAGYYIVVLYASLTTGQTCEVIDSVKVEAVAQFSTDVKCPGDDTKFTDVSTFIPVSGISSWSWDFGDPSSGAANTSSTTDPDHNYAASGLYDVRLTVTAESGCTSTASAQIEAPESTVPLFAPPAAVCAGNASEFVLAPSTLLTEVRWDFGDPASNAANSAEGNTVYHNYTPAGSYSVTATGVNIYGCTATYTQPVNILPNNLAGTITPAAPAAICEGKSLTLTAPAGGVSYVWSDGLGSNNTLVVGEEGSYEVTLTDANGCTYTPPAVDVQVTPAPDGLIKALLENDLGQVIGVSYPTLEVCAGEDVHMLAVGNGTYNYQWPGGVLGNDLIFSEDRGNLLGVGNYLYTITVTDVTSGCTSVSDPFLVNVHDLPSGFSISASTFCPGANSTLQYTGPQPPNWQLVWNNGATGPQLIANEPGIYYMRVTNEFGCSDISNKQQIYPGPRVEAVPSGCHVRCKPDTLCFPFVPNIMSWQWYHDGVPVPGNWPQFIVSENGTYWVELTDYNGCTAQSGALSLELYDGYGDILGQVWSDVNGNGMIDGPDTLVQGIGVQLYQNGASAGAAVSNGSGDFVFDNILSTSYALEVDAATVPANWSIIIGQASVSLSGCDVQSSVDFLLHYTQCQTDTGFVTLQTCPGQPVNYNGVDLFAGNVYNFSLATGQGCDSTVTVSVGALPTSASTLNVKVCPGDTYTYQNVQLGVGQTQAFILSNSQGCDSTVTVSVGALPTSASTLNVKVCPGDTYTYQNVQLGVGQTQAFILSNYQGCDSTVTVSVGALPTSASTLNVKVCPGDTYIYQNVQLGVGQTQAFILSNYQGCDSTVTVSVGALATSASTLNAKVCPGETFTYNNVQLGAGQSQVFTLSNYLGCDSLLTVSVSALPVTYSSLQVKACKGDVYMYQGDAIPAGDTRIYQETNYLGCDSIITVIVQEIQPYQVIFDVMVCPGETFTVDGVEIAPGTDYTFTGQTWEGCDSLITYGVAELPDLTYQVATSPSCPNLNNGSINFYQVNGGTPPWEYSIDGGATFQTTPEMGELAPGVYNTAVLDDNGCVFEQQTVIGGLEPLVVNLPDAVISCDSSGVLLQASVSGDPAGLSWRWWNDSTSTSVWVSEAGPVWIEAQNQCETVRAEATVAWADLPGEVSYVYVPNAFSPEAKNAENSMFRPYFATGLELISYRMEVYDRWGNFLYETVQPEKGWEGPFRKRDMQPAVFVWILDAQVRFCGRILNIHREGDVTIAR